MACHLVSSLAWIEEGSKDCCRSGIEDGLCLGAALGMGEGSGDGFEDGCIICLHELFVVSTKHLQGTATVHDHLRMMLEVVVIRFTVK
jgi:hypothetical protein